MIRLLERGIERLRISKNEPALDSLGLSPDAVAVEWCGRAGHPSSYGMLAVRKNPNGPTISAMLDNGPFIENLAGEDDVVLFGLPEEYRQALLQRRSEIEIVGAAHGLPAHRVSSFRKSQRWQRVYSFSRNSLKTMSGNDLIRVGKRDRIS